MKRFIYLIIFIGICTQLQAQDAIVVQRKDGSVQHFLHGIYKADVNFWGSEAEGLDVAELSPEMNMMSNILGNGITLDDSSCVSYCRKDNDNQYGVFFIWRMSAPTTLPYSLCLSGKPLVDEQHCDTLLYVNYQDPNYPDIESYCIFAIGSKKILDIMNGGGYADGKISWRYGDASQKFYTNLHHGQTYYYRIAAHIPSLRSDGRHDTLTVYGPEYSFRIPDLMTETDELPIQVAKDGLVYPCQQAWDQYRLTHFEAEVELPDAEAFGKMWMQWLQTPQALALDTSTAVPHVFDDGTIHFLSTVPEAFHEWAMSREIVITDLTDIRPTTIFVTNQSQPQCEWSLVTTEREDWPLLLQTYIKATPVAYTGTTNYNSAIEFDTRGMMPGVTYRLTVTFAPEGELPQTEENTWYFKPTRLQMGFYPDGESNKVEYLINSEQSNFVGTKYFLQSGTEPTIFTFTAPTSAIPNHFFRISTAVRPPDLNSKAQINTLRVAEVRLTPMQP